VKTRYRMGHRSLALAVIPLAGLLVFSPTAWAQAVNSTTTLTASPTAGVVGEPVVFTAVINCPGFPDPGGLGVTFFDGGDILDTVPVTNSQATLTTTFSTVGTHNITAAYNGDINCGASNDAIPYVVTLDPTPPGPTPTPTPPVPGQCRESNVVIGGDNTYGGSGTCRVDNVVVGGDNNGFPFPGDNHGFPFP
jgi:hypothetical protein